MIAVVFLDFTISPFLFPFDVIVQEDYDVGFY